MNKLTCDYIAIDTNVFEHMLNPQNNINGHIDELLKTLMIGEISLVVDEERKIENEYGEIIEPIIRNNPDEHIQLQLLRYWIFSHIDKRKRISVSNNELMRAIRGVITENEVVDRTFVYVAFKCDYILITNDKRHIIEGHPKEKTERRETLLKSTRKYRPDKKSEILSSTEAADRLLVSGQNNARKTH